MQTSKGSTPSAPPSRKEFALVAASSCLVGLLYLTPHLVAGYWLGERYHPLLYSNHYSEEAHYAARVQSVISGRGVPNATFTWEGRRKIIPMPPFGTEVALGLFGRVTGINAEQILVISDFVFPALLVALVWAGMRRFSPFSPSFAVGAAVFVASDPYAILRYWKNIFLVWQRLPGAGGPWKLLFLDPTFARFVNLQHTGPAAALAILGLTFAVTSRSTTKTVVAGSLLGASFYLNFYLCASLLVGTLIVTLLLLFRRRLEGVSLAWAVLIGALIAAPLGFLFVQTARDPGFADTAVRNGLETGRRLVISKFMIAMGATAIAAIWTGLVVAGW